MSVLSMLRRSGSVTLLVHASRTACAALAVAPLAAPLQRALTAHVYHRELDAGDAALLLQVAVDHVFTLLPNAAAVAIFYVALTPLLTMLWLHSMLHAPGAPTPIRRALADYPSALALGAATLSAVALLGVLIAGVLYLLPEHLPESPDAQTAIRLGGIVFGSTSFIAFAALHDRARAALCVGARGTCSAFRFATRNLTWRDIAYRGLVALSYAVLALSAELASRAASGHIAPFAVAGLQQLCLMPATLVQALWLAHTLADCTIRRS